MNKNPLTQALLQFATVIKPTMMPPNGSNPNVDNNAPNITEIKDTALNVSIKLMVESSKMTEASKDKTDHASVLIQEHHKRNCKKVRMMMNNDQDYVMLPIHCNSITSCIITFTSHCCIPMSLLNIANHILTSTHTSQ